MLLLQKSGRGFRATAVCTIQHLPLFIELRNCPAIATVTNGQLRPTVYVANSLQAAALFSKHGHGAG